jgi:hypothetical protein
LANFDLDEILRAFPWNFDDLAVLINLLKTLPAGDPKFGLGATLARGREKP